MKPSIYLINPAADFPTYMGLEVYKEWGLPKAALVADLALPTVASMIPDNFDITLCDEQMSEIDFDNDSTFIGITGKITQSSRMINVAKKFRAKGKTVIMGGPYASLSPEVLRPHCDILVIGELEDIYEKLFSDLLLECWDKEYIGGRPSLDRDLPIPRWDLYANDRAIVGTVQTSRGCPFECEFCDVIQYLGRKQRHKPIDLVIKELDNLYRYGYRYMFFADDNFTVYRKHAKELLLAVKEWNLKQTNGYARFITQVSIDASRDPELLQMCAEAGITNVFIGIETPNEDSLKEVKKRQNLKINMQDEVQKFFDHGISVTGGMIVGFDADDKSIFKKQLSFAMDSGIPMFTLGALVAPNATPLYARMVKEARLRGDGGSEVPAMPWDTNIVPKKMTHKELINGMQWLCNKMYNPKAFSTRILQFMDRIGERRDPRMREKERWGFKTARQVENDSYKLLSKMSRMMGEDTWSKIRKILVRKPEHIEFVFPMVVQYCQIRHMYNKGNFWIR